MVFRVVKIENHPTITEGVLLSFKDTTGVQKLLVSKAYIENVIGSIDAYKQAYNSEVSAGRLRDRWVFPLDRVTIFDLDGETPDQKIINYPIRAIVRMR